MGSSSCSTIWATLSSTLIESWMRSKATRAWCAAALAPQYFQLILKKQNCIYDLLKIAHTYRTVILSLGVQILKIRLSAGQLFVLLFSYLKNHSKHIWQNNCNIYFKASLLRSCMCEVLKRIPGNQCSFRVHLCMYIYKHVYPRNTLAHETLIKQYTIDLILPYFEMSK